MTGVVYLITELDTGKVYVGQTNMGITRRWKAFLGKSGSTNYMKELVLTRGPDKFKIEELMDCYSREEMNHWEKFFILSFRSFDPKFGYNKSLGGFGAGSMLQSTRDKLKRCVPPSQLGRTRTAETCARISKAKLGVKLK